MRTQWFIWFEQKCPYIQWMLLLLMLPCTRVLVVGVTSFFERGSRSQVSLVMGELECLLRELCFNRGPLGCGPCLPFYSSQDEGSDYNCGKKVKREEMKEKNKKVALGVAVFLLIRREQFSAGTQWALSFLPLRPLVQRAMATLWPMCFYTVEDGQCVYLDLHREGVR
jgi:hypothetical protein